MLNDQQLQQLASALTADPSLKPNGEWLADHACAMALNGAKAVTVARSDVAPKELLACILPSVWKALDPADRELLTLKLSGDKPLDFASGVTAATFDELFPAGTPTGDAILATVMRTLPPTVAVYGRELDAADIERAKYVSQGLHPDWRAPDEPVMAKLFAEKALKEHTDIEARIVELDDQLAKAPAPKRAEIAADLARAHAVRPEKVAALTERVEVLAAIGFDEAGLRPELAIKVSNAKAAKGAGLKAERTAGAKKHG